LSLTFTLGEPWINQEGSQRFVSMLKCLEPIRAGSIIGTGPGPYFTIHAPQPSCTPFDSTGSSFQIFS
jgi:hypothetical protein